MNRRRVIFLIVAVGVLACTAAGSIFLAAVGGRAQLSGLSRNQTGQEGTPALGAPFSPMQSGNAFVTEKSSGIFLPESPRGGTAAPVPGATAGAAPTSAASLSDVKNIIASSLPSGTKTATTTPLPLPEVPDSAIAINSSGVSTTLGYMLYFGAHAREISFDSARFSSVLKDKNGTPLFIPSLVAKALADNNFSEVQDSLVVQRDFANAEIAFMKSIKVAGGAVALDKEAIGVEELTVDLASKALAVGPGGPSPKTVGDFYSEFSATTEILNGQFASEVQSLALASRSENESMLSFLGIVPLAQAQAVTAPFGGQVLSVFPAILAVIVTIGTPMPAVVIVPDAFLASPLFFSFKSLVPGSWWLGLYNPESGEIIMTGTSLPPP